MLAGFGGATEALRAAEVMDPDEVHDWTGRMHVALGLEPLDPAPEGFRGARAVYIGDGEPPAPPPTPPVARFVELIPVRGADREIPYGGRLQILGIERYDSMVAVAWRMAPLPDVEAQYADELAGHDRDTEGLPEGERELLRRRFLHRLSRPTGYELGLTDDLGTEYRHTGGGSGGGGNEQIGRAQFMPAIPEGASKLVVQWGDLAFDVSMSGPDEAD